MTGFTNRPLVAAAVVGAVALIAGVLALAGVFSGEEDQSGGTDAEIDFGSGASQVKAAPTPPQVTTIKVPLKPDAIAVGEETVWVTGSLGDLAARIDPRTNKASTISLGGFATDVSADGGVTWFAIPDESKVARLEGDPEPEETRIDGFPIAVSSGESAVWALSQDSLQKLDTTSGDPVGEPIRLDGTANSLATGEGSVWVELDNREVVEINPGNGQLEGDPAPVPGAFNVTVGEGAVWVLGAAGRLSRIDPATGEVTGQPVRAPDALDVAAGLGYVWVTSGDGTLRRIDPKSGEPVGEPIRVGRQPDSVAVGGGAVWVANARDGTVSRIDPR